MQALARIAIFSALGVVSRLAFAALPNIQPITALFFVLMEVLGLPATLLIMAVTMLVTSFLLGFGPWVLGQLLAYALVLILARGGLALTTKIWQRMVLVALLSLLYGWLMSLYSAAFFEMPVWAYWLNGLSFDLLHAGSTLLFYPTLYQIFRRMQHEKIMD